MFLYASITHATHYAGYDMSIKSQSAGLYKIKLIVYRDVDGVPMQNTESVSILQNNTNAVVLSNIILNRTSKALIKYSASDMAPIGSSLLLEKNVYESGNIDLSSLQSSSGYYIIGHECCTPPGINNILFSESHTAVFTLDFPALSGQNSYANNSSPVFTKDPLAFFCVNKSYSFNLNVSDSNNDSLSYSLVTPYDHTNSKPFNLVDWAPGYNLNYNILDAVNNIHVNAVTGQVNFTPTVIGTYLLTFKVDEFRNGVKIGTVYREIIYTTSICNEAAPVLFSDSIQLGDNVLDTIDLLKYNEFNISAFDYPIDTLSIDIIPNLEPGENIFDTNLFYTLWGKKNDTLYKHPMKLVSVGVVYAELRITPKCAAARSKPYSFSIVVRDNTYPYGLVDSVHYLLYVNFNENQAPYFVSPDTSYTDFSKNYFVYANEIFSLEADSILLVKDNDDYSDLIIWLNPDPQNGMEFNNSILFTATINLTSANGFLKINTDCYLVRDEPYVIDVIALDNNCYQPKQIMLRLNIYLLDRDYIEQDFCYVEPIVYNGKTANSIYIKNNPTDKTKGYNLYSNYLDNPNIFNVIKDNINSLVDTFIIDTNTYDRPYQYVLRSRNACFSNSFAIFHSPLFLSSEIISSSVIKLQWNDYFEVEYDSVSLYKDEGFGYFLLSKIDKSQIVYFDSEFNGDSKYFVEISTKDSCVLSWNNSKTKSIRSNIASINPTNVNRTYTSAFNIYPNPGNDLISISGLNPLVHKEYKVFSSIGKIVSEGTIRNNQININEIEAGSYILNINDLYLKFIKQ